VSITVSQQVTGDGSVPIHCCIRISCHVMREVGGKATSGDRTLLFCSFVDCLGCVQSISLDLVNMVRNGISTSIARSLVKYVGKKILLSLLLGKLYWFSRTLRIPANPYKNVYTGSTVRF
jgi:hypothetical protein